MKGWLLLGGAAVALGLFAWLLSFHPTAGRAYAAYGGVYVALAVAWGWLVERIHPDRWDIIGAVVALVGMGIIAFTALRPGSDQIQGDSKACPRLSNTTKCGQPFASLSLARSEDLRQPTDAG